MCLYRNCFSSSFFSNLWRNGKLKVDRDEEFYVGNIICIYICMYVSNFKSFLSLEVYDYIDDRDDCDRMEIRGNTFSLPERVKILIWFLHRSQQQCERSSTLITKETIIIIIIRGYSPPRGRSPAAQPCASNLKRENNHFYPRSFFRIFVTFVRSSI